MELNIEYSFSGFINFCAKNPETIEMVRSSKDGIRAVEKVSYNLSDLSRLYVQIKKGSIQFSSGIESTLIAYEIVKRV